MASPTGDLRNLQRNSTAVAGEFREFLAKMEGKSPQEVLGAIATSGLGKSFVTATVMFVVLTAVLTVTPYAWGLVFGGSDATEEVAETAAETPADKPAGADAATGEGAATANSDATAAGAEAAGIDPATGKELVDKLGVGETKDAPENVNPLESAADDLLKGLE